MTKDVKIFITYHDEHTLLKSAIIHPIQTGCALASKRFEGMWQDDDGENISIENPKYNELSAQYWVWKNYDKIGDPDYIGFMHYRRHFMFDEWKGNENFRWLPNGALYKVPYIDNKYITHIQDKYIKKQLQHNDVLIIKPYDVRYLKKTNLRSQYGCLPKQDVKNFDILIQTAKKLAPEYLYEIEMIEYGSIQFLCNMFVMPKKLFFRYNEFCFPILKAVDEQIDKTGMDDLALRYLGYLGEFLLSVFIFHIHRTSNLKIKELNASYLLSDKIIMYPKFKCCKYYLFYKLCYGNKRKKYKQKYKKMKQLIKSMYKFRM